MNKSEKENFSELFDRYYQRLFNYAFKMIKDQSTSEELIQETFIKLWENINKLNPSHRTLESFLIVTLKNKIIDHHRKVKNREKHVQLFKLNSKELIDMDNFWEISDRIESILKRMDKKSKEIFELSRYKGLTYKEISVDRNISVKTVELHISKALKIFRKELKDFL